MAITTDAVHIYDENNLINSSYTGPAMQVGKVVGSNDVVDNLLDIDFLPNGKPDKDAIVTFSGGDPVRLYKRYDQVGTKDLVIPGNGNGSPVIYDGSAFEEDALGNIETQFPGGGLYFENADLSVTNFSYFVRLRGAVTITDSFTINGIGSNSGYFLRGVDLATGDVIASQFGSNGKSFVNNTQIANQGEFFSNHITGSWNIVSATNLDYPTTPTAGYRFGYGRFDDAFPQYFSTTIFYSGDKEADISTKISEIESLFSPKISGSITLSGVAQANAVVDIISCPTVSEGTKTIVEQVTADGSGNYSATVDRNTALNYWAEPRHYVEEFTGTLTPVSGTTFSTGVDLSGVSIGGANDPLYVLKSTGGTASGEEVVVESRSGNDITLSYDPGFDGTTTFSLGKAYGTNTVLARSSVS